MTIYYQDDKTTVYHGDCIEVMCNMPENSVDAIVTDPPYGLSNTTPDQVAETIVKWVSGDREYLPTGKGFMGKAWDAFVPPVAVWDEAMRVLKPGGHILAFAGTRTMDLMTLGLRLAGFDIRDSVAWLYGSGFPKSHDVSKAIEKQAGKAAEWSGWGTALKPANEPIVMARKPFKGTVAANVLEHGTGALNIDATRIDSEPRKIENYASKGPEGMMSHGFGGGNGHAGRGRTARIEHKGRWPANVILDEHTAQQLDQQSGVLKSGGGKRRPKDWTTDVYGISGGASDYEMPASEGGASRFFYVAKAPKRERPEVNGVKHTTVKPLTLMRYLVRMVTPPNGIVLDPFAGSGTTIEAALLEGFQSIGIELTDEYLPLIQQRIQRQWGLL